MRKILQITVVFLLGIVFFGSKSQVLAAACDEAPKTGFGDTITSSTTSKTITLDLSQNFDPTAAYQFRIFGGIISASGTFKIDANSSGNCRVDGKNCVSVNSGKTTLVIDDPEVFNAGKRSVDLYMNGSPACSLGDFTVSEINAPGDGCIITAYQNDRVTPTGTGSCYQNQAQNACFDSNKPVIIEVSGLKNLNGQPWDGPIGLTLDTVLQHYDLIIGNQTVNAATPKATFTFNPVSSVNSISYLIQVEERKYINEKFLNCKLKLTAQKTGCGADQCNSTPTDLEIGTTPTTEGLEAFSLCKQIPEDQTEQRRACAECTGGSGEFEGNEGVWTAVGCIKRDPQSILQTMISVGLGMSGGVALLTFLAAGFIFSTSQGDPKAYGKAKEMMTASIVGIIFIIFSVTILQFIGFSVLKIPGFGG